MGSAQKRPAIPKNHRRPRAEDDLQIGDLIRRAGTQEYLEAGNPGAEEMGFPRQKVKARRVAPSELGNERVSIFLQWGNDSLMTPRFFATPAHFRQWLESNHGKCAELCVGYYKKKTGRPSITWSESVDEALCFGWIDGIRKPIDETSYQIRFTPRRKTSVWSAVNIRNVQRLIDTGRMHPAGLAAFHARKEDRCEIYSYEQRPPELPEKFARALARTQRAAKFFGVQPPGYRRRVVWWIISAKQEPTRMKRLEKLIPLS